MADLTTANSGYQSGSIDSATTLVNNVSPTDAQHVNGPASACVQIETILGIGTTLKGSTADLATRLAVSVNADGTLKPATTTFTGGIELATQAEVNTMTDTSRALTPNHNKLILGTMSTTTSGTAFDYTIPAGVRRVVITFSEVSLSGNDDYLVQLGDAGGIESSGYISTSTNTVASSNSTSGFIIRVSNSALVASGQMTLVAVDSATFSWVSSHSIKTTTNLVEVGGGSKSLSQELSTVRITRTGTNTFDAGTLNVIVER